MTQHQPCQAIPLKKQIDSNQLPNTIIACHTVHGMGCDRCTVRVHKALLSLKSVIADVFLENKLAAVAYDPAHVLPETLIQAVQQARQNSRQCYKAEIPMISHELSTIKQTSSARSWIIPDGSQLSMTHNHAAGQG